MASKPKFQAIRGTRDLLPPDTALWNHVEETAHAVFATFGFGEIRPPIFEPTELFARAVGGDTDIVSKEMYSFEDGQAKFPDLADLTNLAVFVEQIEKAYKTGEIPASEWNQGMIERINLEIKDYRNAQQELLTIREVPNSEAAGGTSFDGPSTEALERYAHHIFGAAHWAHLVRAGEEVSLRPEATASVCRAYIEHNMQQLPQPQKLYYIGADVPPRTPAKRPLPPVLPNRRGSLGWRRRSRHRR